MTRRRLAGSVAGLATLVVCLSIAAPAQAEFGLDTFDTALTGAGTYAAPSTTNQLRAAAHPDLSVGVRFKLRRTEGNVVADGDIRRLRVDLPPGLTVNPTAAPTCEQRQFFTTNIPALCPTDTQVGTAQLSVAGNDGGSDYFLPIFNMAQPEGAPAQFAFDVFGVAVKLNGRLRADGGYSLAADTNDLGQTLPITGFDVRLWGVPADPVHDTERAAGGFISPGTPVASTVPPRAFVTNPTSCRATPQRFTVTARSWRAEDPVVTATDETEPDGTPYAFSGCDGVPFDSSATVTPTTTAPDSPTGLNLSVSVPQDTSPVALGSAHLRDLRLTLPDGMAIDPSAAAGLQACSSAQIGLGTDDAPTCPDASTLGTASLTTPLLPDPLEGRVFLAKQGDNPFGTLLGLYLVFRGQDVVLKLAGRIDLDPGTGRLVATFADNPQLPFSRLDVRLGGGPTAPLVTPPTCGPQTASVDLTPWSGAAAQTRESGFSVDCAAGLGGFAPGFGAGTRSPVAGASAPLVLNVDRPDGQAALNGLSLTLPTGLLAKLRGVPRCVDVAACEPASRVGSAAVTAGAGSQPFPLTGDVFLTGAYKGAPFGLAVRVRVIAGPLDLGTVLVRQALFIDPDDTHVTVVSDPLPTILEGIPIRLRTLDVSVDRPDFVVNPTSCAAKRIGATLGAVDGRTASQSVAFRVGGCNGLALTPKLSLALKGRESGLRDGGHPRLEAVLSQPGGQSNLRTARVTLPLSLALDPDNAQALCETADGAKSEPTCPKGSIVGYARATTPLLDRQLGGFVYFVKGQRQDPKTGRIIRTLPTLVVPLSGDGVRITLRAKTAVSKDHLVTTFERIPDAPVSRFKLFLSGSKHGILVTNGNACRRSRKTAVAIRGQNGVTTRSSPTLGARCKR